MLVYFLCFLAASAYSLDEILLVYSDKTPLTLVQQFSNLNKKVLVSHQTQLNASFCEQQVSIIIDLTLKSSYFTLLEDLAKYCSSIYLTITPTSLGSASNNRFYIHGSLELESDVLLQLINHLTIKKFSLITSNSLNDLQILNNILKVESDQLFSSIVYDPNFLANNIKLQVKRFIKTKGVKKIVMVGEGSSLQTIQDELYTQNLIVNGNYFIIGYRGIYSASIEGALVLAEPGTESATSYENFEFLSISAVVHKVIKFSKNFKALLEICPEHRCTTSYNIVNIQNSVKTVVGNFTSALSLTDSIVYPGNNKNLNINTTKTKLVLSLANGTSEIYNQGYVPTFAYWYQGAQYALQLSNVQEEIEGFEFEFFPTNCGNFMYDPTWYTTCFSQIADNLGFAYLTSIWSTGALGNLLTMKNFQKFIPQISPYGFDYNLESKADFPEFLKMTISYKDSIVAGFSLFLINNWHNGIIFSSDDDAYKVTYQQLTKYFGLFNVNILNPKDKQVFPGNYTRDQFEQYRDYFEAAKNTKCRVYYIFSSITRYILEGLYDVGINKEDVIILGNVELMSFLTSTEDEQYKYKIKDYILNSITFRAIEFTGTYGLQVKSQLLQTFPSTDYLGITFDSFLVIKDSIKLMIEKGEDYEDKNILMSTIRNIKTTGVGGAISYDPDTNNKANTRYCYSQILKNDTTGEYEYIDKILIDKYGATSYLLLDRIVWPDGSTIVPSDMIVEGNCPFRDFQVQDSDKGLMVLYIVCSVVFAIVFITAVISCKLFKSSYSELNEPKIISIEDYGFYFYFYIEFFQILSMGPDQHTYKYIVNNFEVFLSLEFALYYKLDGDKFWYLYYATVILTVIFVISTLAITVKNFLGRFFLRRTFLLYFEKLFIICHFMYLPLISMILNIFNCRESIANDLESSFLEKDCTTFCYKGSHKKWAIGSGCLLLVFLTIVTYFRPYYETIQTSLHIKTNPVYIQLLSIFQVLLVIINKCVKEINQSAAGFIQTGIILAFILVTVCLKPYNYSKAIIAQIITLTMAAYAVLISSIFIRLDYFRVWIMVEFLGLLMIYFIGFFVVKSKTNLLYIEKVPISVEELFRFQFFGKNKILYKISMSIQQEINFT